MFDYFYLQHSGLTLTNISVVVAEIPQNYMIKAWRKKFLEKTRQFKRFVESKECAVFQLDDLSGDVEQRSKFDEPLVSVSSNSSAFDQYQVSSNSGQRLKKSISGSFSSTGRW